MNNCVVIVSFVACQLFTRSYELPISDKMVVRTYQDELKYLERAGPCEWRIKKGFVENMQVS